LSASSVFADGEKEDAAIEKTNLHDKFYRQALFEYFQEKPAQALKLISNSKSRLGYLDEKSRLFEAGLQLSIGLQQQAKQTLLSLNESLEASFEGTSEKTKHQNKQQTNHSKELLLVALLSLAEQHVEQGELLSAQQVLQKIKQFPQSFYAKYYAQYHVLSQLAYWPAIPPLITPDFQKNSANEQASLTDNVFNSPYIQLNKALLLLEQTGNDEGISDDQNQQVITLLTLIKKRTWQAPEKTFWQALFSSDPLFEPTSVDEEKSSQHQAQAINDYASLLLAQLYVKHQQYEKAFVELKTFPQDSPYSESALFLFSFSAQQVKQYTIAYNLLNLLHKNYPYSHLGWQAGELKAAQVVEQSTLEQGWTVYQQLEAFYQQRLQHLLNFERSFINSHNLLSFSSSDLTQKRIIENAPLEQATDLQAALKILPIKPYLPTSIWLQKALYDAELTHLYKGLATLDLLHRYVSNLAMKNEWLEEIIRLNQARKARILSAVDNSSVDKSASQNLYQSKKTMLASLMVKREQLALLLEQASKKENGLVFADQNQQAWLERIDLSKKLLADISERKNTQDYQTRLQRVEKVLTWQLKQSYPERVWQHKKQLQLVDKAISEVKEQQQRLDQLIHSQGALTAVIERQKQNKTKAKYLLNEITQLREKMTEEIIIKVVLYINIQRTRLENHLLSTRRSMANVLEQMSSNDKKIERQLSFPEGKKQAGRSE
jgi:hypothetical protein